MRRSRSGRRLHGRRGLKCIVYIFSECGRCRRRLHGRRGLKSDANIDRVARHNVAAFTGGVD